MKNGMKIIILVLALIMLSSCGKKTQENASNNLQKNETVGSTQETKKQEQVEIEEATKPTLPVLEFEYSIPEGEGAGSVAKLPDQSTSSDDSQGSAETEPVSGNTVPNEGEKLDQPDPSIPVQGTVVIESCDCDYKKYIEMSPVDQEAFMETFVTVKDFINWCKIAEEEHKAHQTTINVTGGDLDISAYIP